MNNHVHRKGGHRPNLTGGYCLEINRLIFGLAINFFILLCMVSNSQVIGAVRLEEVTLNVKNEPLESVMLMIRKQTGYSVVFSDSRIQTAKPLTVNIYKKPLEVALDIIFKDQPLSYLIREKSIIVLPKAEEPVGKKKTEQPIKDSSVKVSENLTGSVVDSTGMGLPGVTVVVKGTTKSTYTDQYGKFVLHNTPSDVTLMFSLIGFAAKEVSANGKSNLRITLSTVASKLDEVVIKGYYTTTREFNTGNIGSIKATDIMKSPVSDPLMALQGRIAGMYIEQSSGVPGSSLRVQIRGRSSLRSLNEPLYIIDGVPFTSTSMSINASRNDRAGGGLSPMNSLNPNDIERIDILKDADATAIYGSRGANGVVLITTKKGKAGKGELALNYYTGVSKVNRQLKLMHTNEYLMMRREAFRNDKLMPGLSDYDVNGTWDTTRYTNFQKELFGKSAVTHDAQISYSGGNPLTQFTMGMGYHQDGFVFPGDFYDKRLSVHTGISHNSSDQRFNLNFNTSYIVNNNLSPTQDISVYSFLPPNMPAWLDNSGNVTWENNLLINPYAIMRNTAKAKTNNLLANLRMGYKILPGLTLQGSIGYNLMGTDQQNKYPFSAIRQPNLFSQRVVTFTNNQLASWIIEPQLNYNRSIGTGMLDVLIGFSYQQNEQEGRAFTATGFASDDLMDNPGSATSTQQNFYQHSLYRYIGLYSRIGYTLNEKYIINLTARRDGSSRFGPGKQFGTFGSAGAAWIFSKERMLKRQQILSFGKLRLSYGTSGNDQIGDYQYFNTFLNVLDYQGVSGLWAARLSNFNYAWEEMKKLEGGIELGFLKDRLMVRGSYYRNRTANQLIGYALPSTTGFTSVQANLPAVLQNTGIELEIESINGRSKGLEWISSLNLTIPRNKLVSFPDFLASSYATSFALDRPLTGAYVYQYEGINPKTGKYIMKDINGDEIISYKEDKSVYQVYGQRFYGGMTNSLRYKGWSVDILIQFVKQVKPIKTIVSNAGIASNKPLSVLQRWQVGAQNSDVVYRSFSTISDDLITESTAGYGDASFIRLKNVSISYMISNIWCRKMGLGVVRLYFQGQNLFTLAKNNNIMLDPEVNGNSLPPVGVYTLGIQVKL
ncbi:SusC/RagA family TonB-linked outer membrane protein [Chitinophaga pendula]|uniref:SusC/RagA family TonB-linked outer membrane protein n=1 Tax=Chitinophaga TaxID=79328 RepID=UPI000BAFD9E0|nr:MULTISPECIES: SusC/RagA family TonB-linked outer membrane protein [Chitinophaga]ASZ13896.1 SusC/RagA family protein [Chitinophaga sp. MD30]UCJ08484.1 SusC/RagA family TonB-linked outer membrane protein [Chitinophaga pendula]